MITTEAAPSSTGSLWMLFTVVLVFGLSTLATGGYDPVAFVVLMTLTAASALIFSRAARDDPEPQLLLKVLVLAWLLKLSAIALRLHLIFDVYGGGDALGYDNNGREIADVLTLGGMPELARFWGSEFIDLATGILYWLVGPSLTGAFLIFAYMGLLGMLLHYKAFTQAFPAGDRRLFLGLVFFYPSLLFWTSSLGKDALMAFFLGLSAYSAALVYGKGFVIRSLLLMSMGLSGVLVIRPHIGAIVAVAFLGLIFLRPVQARRLGLVVSLVGILVFVGIAGYTLRTAASFINLELSVEGVTEFAQVQTVQTSQGGSAFEAPGLPSSPQAVMLAAPNVLFRPYPWEGDGLARASAVEGLILLVLTFLRLKSVARSVAEARRHGFLAFVVIFVLVFVLVFSAIGNFGILARQRAMVLPFVFVLLAYLGPLPSSQNASPLHRL